MMEAKDREHILSNYSKLIKCLSDVIGDLCNFLLDEKIITKPMKENVLSYRTLTRQTSDFLDLIPTRGKRAYGCLYQFCILNGKVEAADILRADRAPHRLLSDNTLASPLDERPLPDKWPSDEHAERVMQRELRVIKSNWENSPEMMEKYERHLNHQTIYPVQHKCRGKAIIICNDIFPSTTLIQREGSEVDMLGLNQLFTGLGFHVKVYQNESCETIKKRIANERKEDHSNHDCFVFFILSHGAQGIVFDTSRDNIYMSELIERLADVEDLKGKPKLFFFQACQKDEVDEGHFVINHCQVAAEPDDRPLGGKDYVEIPQIKDCYVFRSAPDGYGATRNTQLGSWFAQAIVFVFSEYAYRCELHDLFLKVNQLLSKAETKEKTKNIAESKSVPHMEFYFFPGLYDET